MRLKHVFPGATLFLMALSLFADESIPTARHISGGKTATVYDYPFVVFLLGMSTPARACTGVLISDEWTLTAAHCADGFRAGDHSWDSELFIVHGYPLYTEQRHATEIVLYPQYDPLVGFAEWEHDIALIRMNEPFRNRTTAVIPLADLHQSIFLRPGVMTTAVGWGGSGSTSMTQAEWHLTACPETPSVHLCTQSDTWVQIGIHSSVDSPLGIQRHVRVAEHRQWINEVMAAQPSDDSDPCADPVAPLAPRPFQPEAVEVTLGKSGGTVTLMTAEGGGYTLNGLAFAGGEVESENGNKYLLALKNGAWTATFQEPSAIEVMLGDHGGTVMITRAEDGTYWIDKTEIQSGGTVTGEDGRSYRLNLRNGRWTTALVP